MQHLVNDMASPGRVDTVAIIGTGEMGAAVGRRVIAHGGRVLTTLTGRSAVSVQRACTAGIEVVDDDEVLTREAGFLLSIVPPAQAITVAHRFSGPLLRAVEKPIFVECNAIAPDTMRRIANTLEPSGCKVIDAGIIGGPPITDPNDKGPRFYASGPYAHHMSELGRFGLDIRPVEGPIGAASALKMSYAGLTKGLIAIGAAMVTGAQRAGLLPALRAELEHSQSEFLRALSARVPSMFPKAYRWIAEMEEIGAFLGSAGDGAEIYHGIARLYERIAAEWEQLGERGPSFTAIAALGERAK